MEKVIARYELWCSNCKFRNIIKTDKPCCDCAMIPINEYLSAPMNFREVVRFDIYCHVCKHKLKGINDQPCDDCINKSTAYKPIKFELDICERRYPWKK